MSAEKAADWQLYICRACGLIYDEAEGDPDSGLAAGTRFADIPEDWECPLCGVTKADFEHFDRPQIALDANTSQLTSFTNAYRGRAGGSAAFSDNGLEDGLVIVGAGTAGWSVAEAVRRHDETVPILLLSSCPANVYHKPELSIAMSRQLDEVSLVRESGQQAAQRLGVTLLSNTSVVGLNPASKQIRTTRGSFQYGKLVLAVGSKPAVPSHLPHSSVWRVNNLEHWSALKNQLSSSASTQKSIAVIGAGMVGCEIAEDLLRAGHHVSMINKDKTPVYPLLPEAAGQRLVTALKSLGLNYFGGQEIAEIIVEDSNQQKLVFVSGETLEVNHIIAATGLATDKRLSRLANVEFKGGYVVDPLTLQTSQPDIYALGDCISINGSACRFIEPIRRQADTIAAQLTEKVAVPYVHSAPVIKLKTRSCKVVIDGEPDKATHWTTVKETEKELLMEQVKGGKVSATLMLLYPNNSDYTSGLA